jgi:hypothetical protein
VNRDVESLVGDLSRFGDEESQMAGLVDAQNRFWTQSHGDWVVLPIRDQPGFFVVSQDTKGERTAREVVSAFIGPSIAVVGRESIPYEFNGATARLLPIVVDVDQYRVFLNGIESLVSTRASIDRVPVPRGFDEADLLRDMRLSIAQGQVLSATETYDRIVRLGTFSQENLRFLRIELLAGTKQWQSLVELPYFDEIQRTRRPRSISECLLEAIWYELVIPSSQPRDVFQRSGLHEKYRSLLGSVDVPRQRGALALAYLSALEDNDAARVERQLAQISDVEGDFLRSLSQVSVSERPEVVNPRNWARELYDQSQYAAVVDLFLRERSADIGEIAVDAVLELDDSALGEAVLTELRHLRSQGMPISRRLSRDLPALETLASDSCDGWSQWFSRVASDERWAGAARTARENFGRWEGLPLSLSVSDEVADALLLSLEGVNAIEVRAALDLLCRLATGAVSEPTQQKFLDAVLLALVFQDNTSEAVRDAFSELAFAILKAGPDETTYEALLSAASEMWSRIASPVTIDWALELLDAIASYPASSPQSVEMLTYKVIQLITPFLSRMSRSQGVEMRAITEELTATPWPAVEKQAAPDETDVWAALNARSVGFYSVEEQLAHKLRGRLEQLAQLKSFTSNADKTCTAALESLARSADVMIVDTSRAAHQATGCIDAVRPRSKQVLPRRGGVPVIIRAVEDYLAANT